MSTDNNDGVTAPPIPSQLVEPHHLATMATNSTSVDGNRDNIEVIFRKIDEEICHNESACPGPRMSILQSWIEHLEQLKAAKLSDINDNELLEDTRANLQRRRSSVASISTVASTAATDNTRTISKSEINMILSHEKNDTLKVRQVCIMYIDIVLCRVVIKLPLASY